MTDEYRECEEECTYDSTDHCSHKCSNCGVDTEVFYSYWWHCPVCGFKIKNRIRRFPFLTEESADD